MDNMIINLNVIRNESGSFKGFRMEGMRNLKFSHVAESGNIVAHDYLEHQNGPKAIGSIGDELEAIGALYFVRAESDHSVHSPADYHLKYNIAEMFGLLYFSNVPLRVDVVEQKPLHNFIEMLFNRLIKKSYHFIKSEAREGNMNYSLRTVLTKYKEYKYILLQLLRTGYNKAIARYKPIYNVKYNSLLQQKVNILFGKIKVFIDYSIIRTLGEDEINDSIDKVTIDINPLSFHIECKELKVTNGYDNISCSSL